MKEKLPNYIYDLDEKILVLGFYKVLLKEHKKVGFTHANVAQRVGVMETTYSSYLHGRTSCSIGMLKKLCQIYSSNIMKKAFDGNFLFTIRNKAICLPKRITIGLAYYIGYLQGDGYLGGDGLRFGFFDEYQAQMERLNNLTFKLFKTKGKIKERFTGKSKKPSFNLEIKSLVVNSFINTVFGIPRGKKLNLSIPKIITSNKMLRHYLAGLYDADGTLPKNPHTAKQLFIDITLKDKKFVEEIKQTLLLFGIETLHLYKREAKSVQSDKPSITWELRIRKKRFILKFLQEIGFYHPDKAKRAEKLKKILYCKWNMDR